MKSSNQNSNVKMPFTRRPQLILFILTACCVISMGYYYIKKENIGLIEVMGLAVLPARLADELTLLKDAMLSGKEIATDDKIASHAIWASEILKKYSDFNADNAMEIIRYEVGRVFEQVLEDAGVFKRDKQGKEAFARFVEQLG